MRWLRQSTAADIVVASMAATTDWSAKSDLAYNASGVVARAWKNGTGSTLALANSAGTGYWRADGTAPSAYLLSLSTGDTDTVGRLRIQVTATGFYSPPVDYTVISQAVYDALFGSVALATLGDATILAALAGMASSGGGFIGGGS